MIPSFLFALEAVHGDALEFAFGIAFLDVFALVELDLAFADADGDLNLVVFPVHGQRNEGVALNGDLAEEFADFGFVKEEAAGSLGGMIHDVALGVFVDMGVVEPDLIVLDPGKGIIQLGFAGTEGLDLGALEDDSSLVGIKDVVVAASLGIGDDIGHKQKQPEV